LIEDFEENACGVLLVLAAEISYFKSKSLLCKLVQFWKFLVEMEKFSVIKREAQLNVRLEIVKIEPA